MSKNVISSPRIDAAFTFIWETVVAFVDVKSFQSRGSAGVQREREFRMLFESLLSSYRRHFDSVKLQSELQAFYYAKDFKDMFPHQIIDLLDAAGLLSTMTQISKLCELIITVPATSASVERSFSALKRIKTYCRFSLGQDGLSSLFLISIEKSLLIQLKPKSDFYDHVMELFSGMKDRRIQLKYK